MFWTLQNSYSSCQTIGEGLAIQTRRLVDPQESHPNPSLSRAAHSPEQRRQRAHTPSLEPPQFPSIPARTLRGKNEGCGLLSGGQHPPGEGMELKAGRRQRGFVLLLWFFRVPDEVLLKAPRCRPRLCAQPFLWVEMPTQGSKTDTR